MPARCRLAARAPALLLPLCLCSQSPQTPLTALKQTKPLSGPRVPGSEI